MNDTSTPLPKNQSSKSSRGDRKGPRRSTLDFIKGFARAYSAVGSDLAGLPGIVLN